MLQYTEPLQPTATWRISRSNSLEVMAVRSIALSHKVIMLDFDSRTKCYMDFFYIGLLFCCHGYVMRNYFFYVALGGVGSLVQSKVST